MRPRRLLAFAAIFVILAASYVLLTWREQRQEQAEQAAKRLFQVKEAEITELAFKKKGDEIHLVKKENDWRIDKPLEAKVDRATLPSLLNSLADLSRERDLGEEQNLKPFGLDKPGFILEFTAKGKTHRLAFGSTTPGKTGYYALKDQDKSLLVISSANKESLDRSLTALRDKTLFAFSVDKVSALKIKIDSQHVELEKTGPSAWRWAGKKEFKVRRDRVESLLRRLNLARIKDFVSETPGSKDLAKFGLGPQPKGEISIEAEKKKERLLLGDKRQDGLYARKGTSGPVFLVEKSLKQKMAQTLSNLEDRRLWSGDVAEVHQVMWGSPDKYWTAKKQEKSWKLTGPGKESLKQSSMRLEMALLKFQDLEYERLIPATQPAEKKNYFLELRDGAGKLLVRVEEIGRSAPDHVDVQLVKEKTTESAAVPLPPYEKWQADMKRLTKPPSQGR